MTRGPVKATVGSITMGAQGRASPQLSEDKLEQFG